VDRFKVIRIALVIIFILLLGRAAQLQLVRGDYYQELSEGNRISLRPINAPRGKIMDKNGKVLVSNKLSYNLYMLPNEIPPNFSPDRLLHTLASLSELKETDLVKTYNKVSSGKKLEPILLKRHMTSELLVKVEENKDLLPGIIVKEASVRDYVYPETLSHVIGYTGEISERELKDLSAAGYDYSGGDMIGKTGLEREYDLYLDGIEGVEQIEINSIGEKVQTLGIKKPRPGYNLFLNLDFTLQKAVEEFLERSVLQLREMAVKDEDMASPTGAAAILMDVNTGSILAMASVPDFSLNLFAKGLSQKDYQNLINNPFNPLLNRATMAAVPPGSIFKLVTGTAAIEELGVRADTNFYDSSGQYYLPGWSRPFNNWHSGGEGNLDFTKAIARSNNIVFYQLGYDLYKKYGGDKLQEYARLYGLGSETGIDLPGEKSGLVPDEKWKEEVFNQGWYPGDSVNLSIGQGGLLTTPIQLIEIIAAIANQGKVYRPRIVDKVVNQAGDLIVDFKPELMHDFSFDNNTLQILKQGMIEVTNASYGTASSHFNDFPIKVAGKTGTAQTGTFTANHGWFGGFAPADNPEVAVLIFLENGGSSSYTVPIARGIFEYYFGLVNKKTDRPHIYYHARPNASENKSAMMKLFHEVFRIPFQEGNSN